ncbi:flavohemoglobin expression-modulating QEGLA motif protein [Bythopirellula polymerisocia]|uniref:Flavohemoglobin expression-modulating QEGLA motif protein n=1 Tax=Bythopirellula polymerisocia TaxID=2528003 RepID=A0A5C6CNU9_9BACT|nr:flavohemoglobin expression-modulating QEGLA motif protein [Bythopirellula polymerisocia]TWU24726.1 hypothetical protein Pla144_36120 [Bythopirellula polymerisocia]
MTLLPLLSLSNGAIEDIRARLMAGQSVRSELPGDGMIYIDRPLPFICVYRQPLHTDLGTRALVQGEASYLVVPHATSKEEISPLVEAVVTSLRQRFNGFLIVEIWSSADSEVQAAIAESDMEPTELRPSFSIVARGLNTPMRTIETLRRQLERVTYLKQNSTVTVNTSPDASEGSLTSLLTSNSLRQWGSEVVGLSVRPIYRNPQTGELYPVVLRSLNRTVGRALKQAFFTFSKTHTNTTPEHFYSLGRRTIFKSVKMIDRRLNDISKSFSFLLQVTPVNAEAAWEDFQRGQFEREPRYYYRPLEIDATELKRRLFSIPTGSIEDPTLGELFHQRQDEIDRKITMLCDIGTKRFVLGSQQVYGEISEDLLNLARCLLECISPSSQEDKGQQDLDAVSFAERAKQEIEYYRAQLPEFKAQAIIRDDMYSGLMCSDGHLLIGRETRIPSNRVDALIQHEIGTHLLTYYNGLVGPFQLLHTGLAGYDSLQEGIAVLAEYLVGGLSKPRLRLLAARVVAVQMLLSGASFVDTFRSLTEEFGFGQRTAYTITMRIYRGGGFTKDAVYLRGLVEILDYLGDGGKLDPLFVGKIASEHIRFIRELLHRKMIDPPALLPRYLQVPGVQERLLKLSEGKSVLDLIMR